MGSLTAALVEVTGTELPANDVGFRPIDIRDLEDLPAIADCPKVRRPRTYRECLAQGLGTDHPCPFLGCTKHLGLDDGMTDGRLLSPHPIKLRLDPASLEGHETCSLAVADKNEDRGLPVEDVGKLMGLSPGSVEAVERIAKWKISTILGGSFPDWPTKKTKANTKE